MSAAFDSEMAYVPDDGRRSSALAYQPFDVPAPHVPAKAPPPAIAARLAAVRGESARAASKDMWDRMDMSVRIVLVMLGCAQEGKPDRIAKQPWASFSLADQASMASSARIVYSELAHFVAVA